MKKYSKIFVTVGTTQFEQLIDGLFTDDTLQVLKEIGCKQLTIQLGNGKEIAQSSIQLAQQKYGVNCEYYRLKATILNDIQNADLVISHAGAGSCIEVLNAKKPLLVVINETLMDNHQTELAEQLHKDGYLLYCTTKTLDQLLSTVPNTMPMLREYERGNVRDFVRELDNFMGF